MKISRIIGLAVLISVISSCSEPKVTEADLAAQKIRKDSLRVEISSKEYECWALLSKVETLIADMDSVLVYESSFKGSKASRKEIEGFLSVIDCQRRDLSSHSESVDSTVALPDSTIMNIAEFLISGLDRREKELRTVLRSLSARKRAPAPVVEKVVETVVEPVVEKVEKVSSHKSYRSYMSEKVHLVTGTRKQLTDAGILKSRGILSKPEVNLENIDWSVVETVDKDDFLEFSVSSYFRFLTVPPKTSYSVEDRGNGSFVVSINDANSFWGSSGFVVILLH